MRTRARVHTHTHTHTQVHVTDALGLLNPLLKFHLIQEAEYRIRVGGNDRILKSFTQTDRQTDRQIYTPHTVWTQDFYCFCDTKIVLRNNGTCRSQHNKSLSQSTSYRTAIMTSGYLRTSSVR